MIINIGNVINPIRIIGDTSDSGAINSLVNYLYNNISNFSISIERKWSCIIRNEKGECVDICKDSPARKVSLEVPSNDNILIDDIMKFSISWWFA